MKTWHKLALGIGGAAAVGGIAYIATRASKHVGLRPEETVEALEQRQVIPIFAPLFRPTGGNASITVRINRPKYIVSYSPGGTSKHGSSFSSDGGLMKMFDPGEVISWNKAEKIFGGPEVAHSIPIYAPKRAILSAVNNPADMSGWTQAAIHLGQDPPGIPTPTVANYGDSVTVSVPPGGYMVTPDLFPFDKWVFKHWTKYWAWTREGPVQLTDPWAPDQPKYMIEALKKYLKDDCTQWNTYVKLYTAGSLVRSYKTVTVPPGGHASVTVRQYIILGIEKWKKKEADSIAFNVWCEVSSAAVNTLLAMYGGSVGKLAVAILQGDVSL